MRQGARAVGLARGGLQQYPGEAVRVPKELKKEPKEAFGAIEELYNTASEKIKEAVPRKLDFTLADVSNAATRAEAAKATLNLTLKTMGIRR